MIDFTTIQHFKIPPSIGELQKTNKTLKNILVGALIVGGLIIVYNIYIKAKKDDERIIKK